MSRARSATARPASRSVIHRSSHPSTASSLGRAIPDQFGTAELRRRVLDAWRDSPARFRADANLEDDLALVGYRDRIIVELAQNAADAATRAGVVGRLVLELDGSTLTAANTGAALDAAGVESIAVARASAKREDGGSVGRFGVGFAAVIAVTDAPSIVSTTGAVRWSREEAASLVAELPGLRAESAARDGQPPVLRLPFDAAGEPPDGMTTAVVLPLRDDDAIEAVRRQLIELDPALLLSLTGLTEIVVRRDAAERVLNRRDDGDLTVINDDGVESCWSVVRRNGAIAPELLVDLPVEERGNGTWSVVVALPVDRDRRLTSLPAGISRVVRAPTPTDDPFTLPLVIIASYPLDSSRRRVISGSLADVVTAEIGAAVSELVSELPADPRLLTLVPTALPDGEVDAAVQASVRAELERTPWLPLAADLDIRQRGRDAVVVPDRLVEPLAAIIAGILPVGWGGAEITILGASRPTIGELVEAVSTADQPAQWWHRLYDGFGETVPAGPERDVLNALPVRLADGSVVTGPRGVAMPDAELREVALDVLGVRVVDPRAAHPLLLSLGATDAGARGLLELPQVQGAVEALYDEDDPTAIATAVLSLVMAAGADAVEFPWLAELVLPDSDGDWRPAAELLLPGGAMASLVAPDSGFGRVADAAVEQWGADALRAVGVLDLPAIVRAEDATGPDHDLDDEAAWWATLPPGAAVPEFAAVRDLEQLRDEALPKVLTLLTEPPLRAAVVEPTLVTAASGATLRVASYTAWWLSSRPVLDGRSPRELRLADADTALTGLFDVAPAAVDVEFLRALGVVGALADVDAAELLARLADQTRTIDRTSLRSHYRHLASAAVEPPDRVRVVRGDDVVVIDAADAVIIDAPDLLPLVGDRGVLPVALGMAAEVAHRLDVALASELATFEVLSAGRRDGGVVVHDQLLVADASGNSTPVPWRLIDGELHVDAGQRGYGIGRGSAWRDGAWGQRHRRTEELAGPGSNALRAAEDDLD
jgi:hypothetical protein